MILLDKIIDRVKTNSFCRNAFNLRIKKADERDIEEFRKKREQVRQEEPPPVPGEVPTPSVPQLTQTQPAPPAPVALLEPPPEIAEKINLWINDNQREMEMESRFGVNQLIEKQERNPDSSALKPADPVLYTNLKQHPEFKDYFVDRIERSIPNIDPEKPSIFIGTIMAKIAPFLGEIEEKERALSLYQEKMEEEEAKGQEKLQRDPYAQATPLPDPKLDVQAYELYLNLDPTERVGVLENWHYEPIPRKDVFNQVYEEMIGKATHKQLSSPEEDQTDQRMNFFLKYPQHLSGIIGGDPSFAKNLQEELSRVGIQEKDLLSGLRRVGNFRSTKKGRILNVLNNEKGGELYKILSGLINNFDPDMSAWLKQEIFEAHKVKNQPYDQFESDEGRTIGLSGRTSKDVGRDVIREIDMDETSKKCASLVWNYLQDDIKDMQLLNQLTTQTIAHEGLDEYRKLEQEIAVISNKKGEPLPGKTGARANLLKEQARAMIKYSAGEKLTAYANSIMPQLSDLLETRGRTRPKDKETLYYRNKYGRIKIPVQVMRDIFGVGYKDDEKRKNVVIRDYDHYITKYKERIDNGEISSPFIPDWKAMINYKLPFDTFGKLGKIKAEIQKMSKGGKNTIDNIRLHLDQELLKEVSNVSPTDSPSLQERKMDSFIFMTTKQNPESITGEKGLFSYYEEGVKEAKAREELEALKNEIKEKKLKEKSVTTKDQKALKEKKEEISKFEAVSFHNFKTRLGDSFYHLLSYVVESMDMGNYNKPFNTKSLRSFINLFDFNPAKLQNFLGVGGTLNPYDKELRTNTELYYKARREDVPKHVKTMYDVYQSALPESKRTHRGVPVPDRAGWYGLWEELSKKFNSRQRKILKMKGNIQAAKDNLEEFKKTVNARAFKALSDPRKAMEIRDKINAMRNTRAIQAAMNTIESWDGVTMLPEKYYSLFPGQAKTVTGLKQRSDVIKNNEKILAEIKKDYDEIKRDIGIFLKQHGKQIDMPGLNLLAGACVRALNRIYKLKQVGNTNLKVASTYKNYINMTIKSIERDIGILFNRLLT